VLGAALAAVRSFCPVLTITVATAWRSAVGGVTRTPDGGTATGAGGCDGRTPDGGTVTGACATMVGPCVWPCAFKVPTTSPTPSVGQETLFLIACFGFLGGRASRGFVAFISAPLSPPALVSREISLPRPD